MNHGRWHHGGTIGQQRDYALRGSDRCWASISSTSRRKSSGRSSTSVIPARIMARCSSSDICRHSLAGTRRGFMSSTVPPMSVGLSSDPVGLASVLLIAAHVLGDINRWWTQHGQHLIDGPVLGEVYGLLHQSVEAEAAWSLLPDRGPDNVGRGVAGGS